MTLATKAKSVKDTELRVRVLRLTTAKVTSTLYLERPALMVSTEIGWLQATIELQIVRLARKPSSALVVESQATALLVTSATKNLTHQRPTTSCSRTWAKRIHVLQDRGVNKVH